MRRQSDHSIKTHEAHVRQLFVTTHIDGMCTVVHGAMAMRDFCRVCDEPATAKFWQLEIRQPVFSKFENTGCKTLPLLPRYIM